MVLSAETASCDQYKWRRTIHEGTKIFQEHETSWANVKRVEKREIIDPVIHFLKKYRILRYVS